MTEQLRKVLTDWAVPPEGMVGKLPKGGAQLDYMGHAAVTRALIEVDPEWTWEPVTDDRGIPVIETAGKRLVMWGTLTVLGKTLVCCGTCEDRKFEPEKELVGDLLRNGAMRFGIGLSLWSKDEWTDLKPVPPFDAVAPLIAELDDNGKAELKAFAHEHGITVTRKALTEAQAVTLREWFDGRADG